MSAYPGFTDGDLDRHELSVKADLRHAEWMKQQEAADAAREELQRIAEERKRRDR